MDKATLEARETALKESEEKLATDQAAFAEREGKHGEAETALALTNAGVFVDKLVGEGRVAPGHRNGLAAFMAQIPDDGGLSFAEDAKGDNGDAAKTIEVGSRAFLESFLGAQPVQVDFKEHTGDDGKTVDAEDSRALASAGLAYQEEQRKIGIDIPIDRAVRHVAEEART